MRQGNPRRHKRATAVCNHLHGFKQQDCVRVSSHVLRNVVTPAMIQSDAMFRPHLTTRLPQDPLVEPLTAVLAISWFSAVPRGLLALATTPAPLVFISSSVTSSITLPSRLSWPLRVLLRLLDQLCRRSDSRLPTPEVHVFRTGGLVSSSPSTFRSSGISA